MRQEGCFSPTVLLVSSREDIATDLVVLELRRRDVSHLRLNCEDFPISLGASWAPDQSHDVYVADRWLSLEEAKSVWYRRLPTATLSSLSVEPELLDVIRSEAQNFLTYFLDTLDLFWVNRPSLVTRAESKLYQLDIAKRIGFLIPRTLITNDARRASAFVQDCGAAVCKPLNYRRFRVNSRELIIFTERVQPSDFKQPEELQIMPVILQEELQKSAEVRVTVVGRQLFACKIQFCEEPVDFVDWHLVDDSQLRFEPVDIPVQVATQVQNMLLSLGLLYACFDFVVTPDGSWVFLEVNPSGQWGWIEKHTGYRITRALVDLLLERPTYDQKSF